MQDAKLSYFPLGAVTADGWLKTQMTLQRAHITNDMEQYADFSAQSGWLGGDGESWERGPYYVRGLVALAYSMHDEMLIARAKKWIAYTLASQQGDGNFGSKKMLAEPLSAKTKAACADEWWARMPMLMALVDYYEAERRLGTPDERVPQFLERYFRFQLKNLKKYPLKGWAKYRGADNAAVVLWYRRLCLEKGAAPESLAWLEQLCGRILSQTFDWSASFATTSTREHVVNTTQGYKYPFINYLYTGDRAQLDKLRAGLARIGSDHGRIDGLPNADEAARDNRPVHGTETCAVVEGMLSLEIAGAVSADSGLYDLLESYLYNNLPNCFDYRLTAFNYFQAENSVLMTHGQHGFANDHGDSGAIGIGGFPCCFSNLHMGYPKFVQSMWARENHTNALVLVCYGANSLDTVLGGKRIVFRQMTDYPYSDTVRLLYQGEKTQLTLKLRVPGWTRSFHVTKNGRAVDFERDGGFAVVKAEFCSGDAWEIVLQSKIEVADFHHHTMYVKKGAVLFCNPIAEDWREISDFRYRGVKYPPLGASANWEIYPAEAWSYTFRKDADMRFLQNPQYDCKKPAAPDNAPCCIELPMLRAENWTLDGNCVGTVPVAYCPGDSVMRRLIPTAFCRLKISVFPQVTLLPMPPANTGKPRVLRKILASLGKVPVVPTRLDAAYGTAQLTFTAGEHPKMKYYILYGVQSGVYTEVSRPISENRYIHSGDPYGGRIQLDKSAVQLDNDKTYYLRVAYMRRGRLLKISEEQVFHGRGDA